MSYIWIYDNLRQRLVLWEYNAANPAASRPVEVHAGPNDDLAGLPAGIRRTPFTADLLPLAAAAAQGDTQAMAQLQAATGTLNEFSRAQGLPMLGAPPAGQQGGQQPLRDLPADIDAQTRLNNNTLTAQENTDRLDQSEHKMRSEMMQLGISPSEFFDQYPQRQAPAGGETSQDANGLRLSADYVNAYGDQAAVAARGAQLARAERLQQISNAWENRKTGADRLQKYGDALRSARSGQAGLDQQELMATRDPTQDKNLMVVPNDPTQPGNLYATPGGTTVHRQNAGAAEKIAADQNTASQMQQQWWPDQYTAQLKEKQRAIAKAGGWIHPSWGIDAQGNDIPAYASGGEYGYLPSAPGAQNLGDPYGGHGTSENSGSDPNQVQAVADYTRQQGFANQMEQSDLSAQLARIQQQAQFQMQQMGQQHQLRMGALQQELSIAQGEAERQRAGLAQQRGWAQGQYDLQPLGQQGGQQWAG